MSATIPSERLPKRRRVRATTRQAARRYANSFSPNVIGSPNQAYGAEGIRTPDLRAASATL